MTLHTNALTGDVFLGILIIFCVTCLLSDVGLYNAVIVLVAGVSNWLLLNTCKG